MLADLRHGLRTLTQAKGWTAVVVISLALGIGANTTLFSAINGLLLRQLAVSDPGTLVRLRWAGRNDMATDSSDYGSSGTAAGERIRATFSYPMFREFVGANRTLTDLFACAPISRVNVVIDGRADIASAVISSGNYYRVLGVSAVLGRTIVPDDDTPSAAPVAVIGYRYWRSRFGGDRGVIGTVIQVNNVPVTIVGVLSPEFTGVQRAIAEPSDVGLPLAIDRDLASREQRLTQPTNWWLQIMGRLKPGVAPEQVQANLAGVFQHQARAGLDAYLASLPDDIRSASYNRRRTEVPDLRVDSGSRGVYEPTLTDLRAVTVLTIVVALVLLIVWANVANLMLSRATTRQKEVSIRLSLGATRMRLIRQMLTESLVLASIGGGLGLAIGYWGRQLLPVMSARTAPLDWRVLAFVLIVTIVTAAAFGTAPAIRATGVNVNTALKATSRSVAGSRTRLSKLLLVVQVAVSLVLLVGAGLFLRTLQNLRTVDIGFDPQSLVLFRVIPELNRYDETRSRTLYEDLLVRLAAVPGVQRVALSQPALLSGSVSSTSIFVQGRTYAPGIRDDINHVAVSPSFFETMRIPLLVGRGVSARDHHGAPKVAVINETAARKYFPNQNPLGQRFGFNIETSGEIEVVGVVRDAKYDSVREPAPPTMYVPFPQRQRLNSVVFEMRTAGDPATVIGAAREVVRRVDPNLPLMDVSTQMEQVERRFLQEKIFAYAYALFGCLAVLLAAIGLFGLMSYSVARRTNEIGIRMALGAQRPDVLRLVLGESMVLVLAGVVIGVGVAFGAGRFVASLLFGLAATDAMTMILSIIVMVLVAAIAGYLPARRASRVDPVVALRYE